MGTRFDPIRRTALRACAVILSVFAPFVLLAPSECAAVDPHSFDPPGVKAIALGSGNAGKVSPGTQVKIQCTIGYVGTLKVAHDGKGADAYLHAGSWQLPFEIRVNDKAVYSEKLPGLSGPTTKWTKEAVWTPTPVYSGKTVWFECVVDPENKVHSSAQKTFATVTGAPPKPARLPKPGTETYQVNPNLPAIPPPAGGRRGGSR